MKFCSFGFDLLDIKDIDKEVSFDTKSPDVRQHVYGVIRFLPPPYSSFQLVRATAQSPGADVLDTMAAIAKSLVISEKPR
jgi:hypothetical protein